MEKCARAVTWKLRSEREIDTATAWMLLKAKRERKLSRLLHTSLYLLSYTGSPLSESIWKPDDTETWEVQPGSVIPCDVPQERARIVLRDSINSTK